MHAVDNDIDNGIVIKVSLLKQNKTLLWQRFGIVIGLT